MSCRLRNPNFLVPSIPFGTSACGGVTSVMMTVPESKTEKERTPLMPCS